jgi:hypothetical protein
MTFKDFLERIEDKLTFKLPIAYKTTPSQDQFSQELFQQRDKIKDKLQKALAAVGTDKRSDAFMYVSQIIDPHMGDLGQANPELRKGLEQWLELYKSGEQFPGQLKAILQAGLKMV